MAIDATVLSSAELLPLSAISPRVLRSLLARCGPHAACYGADIAAFLGGDAGRFVVALGACLCLRAFPQTSRLDSPTASCETLLAAVIAVVKEHCTPGFVATAMAQLAVLESDLDAIEARMRGAHPRVSATQFASFIGSPQPAAPMEAERHSFVTAYLAGLDAPSPDHSDDRESSAADRVTPGQNRDTAAVDGASTTASPTPPGGSSKAARRRARRRALEQNNRRSQPPPQQQEPQSHHALDQSTATEGAAVFEGSIIDTSDHEAHHVARPAHPAVLLVAGSDESFPRYHPPTHPGFQRGVMPQGPYSTMFHHPVAIGSNS